MKLSWLVSIVLAWGLSACTEGDEAQGGKDAVAHSAESSRPVVQSAARAGSAAEQSIEARAEELLDFGETSSYGTDLLWPHSTTQSWGPFRFRHYPRKGVYVGVAVEPSAEYTEGGVYVMGGPFGAAPTFVGRVEDFIGPAASPAANPLLAFDPPLLSMNVTQGQNAFAPLLRATPKFGFEGKVYLRFGDPDRRWGSMDSEVEVLPGDSVLTAWASRADLATGVHAGALQVRVCATSDCTVEYEGSPVRLPYRLGVVRAMPDVRLQGPNTGMFINVLRPGADSHIAFRVSSAREPVETFYFQAVDAGGYIQQSGQLQPGGSERELRFKISLPEGPARYEGSFAVRVCWDPACTDVLSTTGPIRYVFTREANDLVDASIGAIPQLTPLRALEGAADWTGARGNPANTGYVPVELDVSKFSLRWRWDLPPGKSGLLQQATMAGKVALAAGGPGSDNAHTELFVLNESDGTVGWRRAGSFSPQGYYGVPALSQTTLYSVVRLVDPMLVAYDLATGAQRFSFTVPSYSYDIPPVVVGNQLLMPRGTGGGVLSVEASSGRTWWRADPISQSWSGAWAPASDGTTAFAYAANTGTLAGYSMTDGSLQLSITDDVLRAVSGGVSATRMVAVHHDRAFVVEDGALVAFDIVTKKPAWRQTTDDYVKGVAVQGGTLIALRQAPLRVEARHPKDGRLLWTTQPLFNLAQVTNPYGGNGVFMGDPVLTDNLVFVSTNSGVFALSRTTGSPLWFYGKGGTLAISSNGVLTVANPASSAALGGGVTAINLH